jgi:LysR family transcriptional regulator, glycine cleavage system transcriptional activator
MKALQILEASARHLNFTHAAIELNLTQTAVSHQIRNLELMLGAKLFHRGPQMRLTEQGEAYVTAARIAILAVSDATERVAFNRRDDTLTIGCLGTFLVKTLLPAIHDFRERHPEVTLRFKVLVPNAPPARPDYDVGIHYGVGEWSDMSAYRLGSERVFPVCSPRLIQSGFPLDTPEDLQRHTVIRTISPLLVRDDWPFWLERAGVPGLSFAGEMSFDLLNPAFQAAIEGLGIVMGRSEVVRNDLAAGRLVEPFTIRISSPATYYLLVPTGREDEPKILAFREWAMTRLKHPAAAAGVKTFPA